MYLNRFTMETVDDLIFDATEAVRGRYHKRPIKGNTQFIFLCKPQKSDTSGVCITCLQITQKVLT